MEPLEKEALGERIKDGVEDRVEEPVDRVEDLSDHDDQDPAATEERERNAFVAKVVDLLDRPFCEPDLGDRVTSGAETVEAAVNDIDEAIERMKAIGAAAPPNDGLAEFNKLYTVITEAVRDGLRARDFALADFLHGLDVAFANRYFDALRAWGTGEGRVPKVWKAVLERRSDPRIAPIQFAVAGVNAHINYDLAPALVQACVSIEATLGADNQLEDYLLINEIFATRYKGFRDDFLDGWADRFDEGCVAKVADYFNNFVVVKARDLAWENAHLLDDRRRNQDQRGQDRIERELDDRYGFVAWTLMIRGFF